VSHEVERALAELARPSGDAAAGLRRGAALQTLLEHGDEAHRRLLELAGGDDPPSLVLLALPRFARPESVAVLERALRAAPAPTTVLAAQALAQHPARAALAALQDALADARPQVVASAALGLAERGDPAACAALQAAAGHEDAEVAGRIEQAREALGCARP
jgi:HEAT repeat protein